MKLFLDSAVVGDICDRYDTGLIDGVTTNPTLILRSGKKQEDVISQIAQLCPKLESISAEVVADNASEMLDQAKYYVDLSPAVTIKVPCTPEGLRACKELSDQGIKVNVTLIFSVSQAILSAKAGATYLSPFVGRVDDQRFGGINLIKRIREVLSPYWTENQRGKRPAPEILSASIRSVGDVEFSFAQGADICTIPNKIFDGMYEHMLTTKGIELFDRDYSLALSENE